MITFIFCSDRCACMKKMDYRRTRVEIGGQVRRLLKYRKQEIIARVGVVLVEEVRRKVRFFI